ncbi:OprD family outer membrane porin [Alloalcanivorax mobilis]|uniref:OprD family outer membrane porin n=1 Tax=Alloalcanivorax mobilis TaxID=2019569 RepID=UPI000B5B20D1|nr:OprD family outer membrane porin [Alloalcanivorax mobilis]ASK35308.1 hypothetical protein CEK62_13415 [Alcanivorax sp. N3-2A]
MKHPVFLPGLLAGLTALNGIAAAAPAEQVDNLRDAFENGSVSGTLRAYHNVKAPEQGDTLNTFAVGASLHAETAPWAGVSAGGTFYASNGLGLQNDDPAKRNANLPENADVLGEAWLQYANRDNRLRFGRQQLDTPFANPSDGFLIPVTFEALAFTNTSVEGLTLSGYYLRRIKSRPDDDFQRVSQFALDRFGVAADSDQGAWIAGARYQPGRTAWQGWAFSMPDLFNLYYAQADRPIGELLGFAPTLAAQLLYAEDNGDNLLDDVNARGAGVKLSAARGPFTLALAWNHFLEDRDSYGGGALPAPFNYSSGPLFTNSMTQTLENSAPGDAYKVTLQRRFGSQWSTQISYAQYQRLGAVDTDETDLDITYAFAGNLKGLSFRLRIGVIGAEQADARFTEIRPQMQYVF